jgi:hypothetical protein
MRGKVAAFGLRPPAALQAAAGPSAAEWRRGRRRREPSAHARLAARARRSWADRPVSRGRYQAQAARHGSALHRCRSVVSRQRAQRVSSAGAGLSQSTGAGSARPASEGAHAIGMEARRAETRRTRLRSRQPGRRFAPDRASPSPRGAAYAVGATLVDASKAAMLNPDDKRTARSVDLQRSTRRGSDSTRGVSWSVDRPGHPAAAGTAKARHATM